MASQDNMNMNGLISNNNTHLIVSIPLHTSRNVSSVGRSGDDYDAEGAMIFIVATVSMYSLGIVAFVAGHIFRKSRNLSIDRQTNVYISTFNRNHLNNLSKLHMLRCMQRKMLAKYNMLEARNRPNRSVYAKYVACNHYKCQKGTCVNDFPRIFQDVVSRRPEASETMSCGTCSLSIDDVSSLTDVSRDAFLLDNVSNYDKPISCGDSNGLCDDWCSATEEMSCETCNEDRTCGKNNELKEQEMLVKTDHQHL